MIAKLHVPAPRINDVLLGKRGISADTALRLVRYFNMTPQFWLNLQTEFDLRVASNVTDLDRIVCRPSEAEPASRRNAVRTVPKSSTAAGR